MNQDTEHAALHHQQELEQMATANLNAALAKARAEIHNPNFDSENPHFRSKFASLKAVINATIPVLAKHGVSVVQDLQTTEAGVACYTHLLHDSGEEKVYGPFVVPPTKRDAQGFASASTYARRYHLMGVVGVVGDVDDDGNEASKTFFKSKQMKAKYYDGFKAAAADDDELKARELWSELDTDQQQEIWASLGNESRVRSTIKKLLAMTANTDDNKEAA